MLVMDKDGSLTDGKIYMSGNGEALREFVRPLLTL